MLVPRSRAIAPDVIPRAVWHAVLVVAGSSSIALGAHLAVPLPFSPVPVTAQTLAVLVVGVALGARLGALSVTLYVVEGLAGLPVFAGGTFGIARLLGPTGGYLVGFIVAAFVVGALIERGWGRRTWMCALVMLAGEAVIYAFGLAWLARFPLPVGLLEAGLIPFIAGDAYKVVAAVALVRLGSRLAERHVAGGA